MKAQTIVKENFRFDIEALSREFPKQIPSQPKLSVSDWLDPERCQPDIPLAAAPETVNDRASDDQPHSAQTGNLSELRRLISIAVPENEGADIAVERMLANHKQSDLLRPLAFHSVPIEPLMANAKCGTPAPGLAWSCYVLPLLLMKQETEVVDINTVWYRALSEAEKSSAKFRQLSIDASAPPALLLRGSDLPNPSNKMYTLIEGAFRVTRAMLEGRTEFVCKIVSWDDVVPFLHLQPVENIHFSYAAKR